MIGDRKPGSLSTIHILPAANSPSPWTYELIYRGTRSNDISPLFENIINSIEHATKAIASSRRVPVIWEAKIPDLEGVCIHVDRLRGFTWADLLEALRVMQDYRDEDGLSQINEALVRTREGNALTARVKFYGC